MLAIPEPSDDTLRMEFTRAAGLECGEWYPILTEIRCQRRRQHLGTHAGNGSDNVIRRWVTVYDSKRINSIVVVDSAELLAAELIVRRCEVVGMRATGSTARCPYVDAHARIDALLDRWETLR